MEKLIMDSHAKINLALDVLGKRDDGYHEIDTIMQSISLKDRLTFESLEEDGVLLIDSNNGDIPLDENNLVYKAWELLKDEFNISKGLDIYIEKKIPMGAGLAGGSSNCATTLKALNRIWELGLSQEKLEELGGRLGADVPFCIRGGTVRARAIGDSLEDLKAFRGYKVLLCNPGIEIDTAEAYGLLELDGDRLDLDSLEETMERGDLREMDSFMANKMEEKIIEEYPIIGEIKDRMEDLGSSASLMTGSGSTVFGIFKDDKSLLRAYEVLKRDFDKVYACETI